MDIFLAVQVDDFFKQRLDLAAVAGLAKHPHNLCYDGFGGHVAGLKDARIVAVFFAYLVDLTVSAFFRALCGNGKSLSGIHPVKDGFLEGVVVFRDAADPKGLQNDGVIIFF